MKRFLAVTAGVMAMACVATAQNQTPAAKPTPAPAATPAAKPATPAHAAKPMDKGALPPGMTAEQMQKMVEAGTPGEAHKKLEAFNGKWNVVCKSWMNGPEGTPDESTGAAEIKTIIGGRFQQQTFTGSMMGQPFEGFGLSGFDNTTKKYWGTWVDSMGTAYMTQTGTADASGKTFTYDGTYECPVFGHCTSKMVTKWVDANTFTMSMETTSKNGPPCKMEMTYTRAK